MSELVQPSAIPFLLGHAAERWPDCDVSDVYPEGPDVGWERPVIALYEQDSYRLTDVSWSQLVAYRVLAGSREYPDEARRIAREVESFLWAAWKLSGANPIAASLESNGPSMVPDDHQTAVLYGTVELIIAGVYAPAKTG